MKEKDTILVRFKVENFRSIEQSDWIDVSENSCLIGTNESGKTNLLIALWKLNPVNNEPIVPLDDFPRMLYSKYKAEGHESDIFVSADFLLKNELQKTFARKYKCDIDQIKTVLVEREYSGEYHVSFPYTQIDQFESSRLVQLYDQFQKQIEVEDLYTKEEEGLQDKIMDFIGSLKESIPENYFREENVSELLESIFNFKSNEFGKKQKLPEFFKSQLEQWFGKIV